MRSKLIYYDISYWLNIPVTEVQKLNRDDFIVAQYRMAHIKKQWVELYTIGTNRGIGYSFKGDDDNS